MQFIKANPREYSDERNDCTVRATSLALNKPYKEIHKAFSDKGRRWGKGVNLATLETVLTGFVGNTLETHRHWQHGRLTLKRFIDYHPTGKWVVIKRGHAFAVIDGVAHDAHSSCCGSRCIVQYAYKVGG